MNIYINSASVISPQDSFSPEGSEITRITHSGNRMRCKEPDYGSLIDPKAIRRMSRIIRMGVAAAGNAVTKAGISIPDSIIVGTAFGCLEDTNQFLSRLVQYEEDMLNPTPFIHSTHNTIAGQIALHFKCYGYNSTYVHRSVSFESALADAMMQIEEGTAKNVLTGGTDEIIDVSFTIMDRLGFYRSSGSGDVSELRLNSGKGTIAGEGAAYFIVSGERNNNSLAQIIAVESHSFISNEEAIEAAKNLLEINNIIQPDLVIAGYNGDTENDHVTGKIVNTIVSSEKIIEYKHLCGDYPTSTSFALWIATEIIGKRKQTHKNNLFPKLSNDPKNILIYNQSANTHHSFILVSAC